MIRCFSNATRTVVDDRPHGSSFPLDCESLEGRLVLSSVSSGPILGTITGQVTDSSTDLGIKHVKIQFINFQGKVAQSTTTNAAGNYAFAIRQPGPYVVHEVVPKGYMQVTPNLGVGPCRRYAPGAGNNSWNYSNTNGIPSVGPVGVAYWSDIAPAGNEPFESPINIKPRHRRSTSIRC